MKISPMDIQRQTFGLRFRGFDREEVKTFLAVLSEEVAGVQREKDELERQFRQLEQIMSEHHERETILKNTLLTAQKAAEDIRESGRREAETIVKQAEIQGDRLLELAQERAHEVEGGILELRAHRTALRIDVRALIARLTNILDLQEEAELADNLRFLKRREDVAANE